MGHDITKRDFLKAAAGAAIFMGFPGISAGDDEPPEYRIPVLAYHSHYVIPPYDYGHNSNIALPMDLELIHDEGYRITPLSDIAKWVRGEKKREELPERAIGISYDDGPDTDWKDGISNAYGSIRSFRSIFEEFQDKHSDQNVRTAAFVIASPLARKSINEKYLSDDWWKEADDSGMEEIYNHSLDHDAMGISKIWDPATRSYLTTAGYGKSRIWAGQNDWSRNDNLPSARHGIVSAARFIHSKIGKWPELFAYPFGTHSRYVGEKYFPDFEGEHGTIAAFIGQDAYPWKYATEKTSPWLIPRFTHGAQWMSPEELLGILMDAVRA